MDEVLFSPIKTACVKESEALVIDTFPQQDFSMLSLKITLPDIERIYYICFKVGVSIEDGTSSVYSLYSTIFADQTA